MELIFGKWNSGLAVPAPRSDQLFCYLLDPIVIALPNFTFCNVFSEDLTWYFGIT